MISRSVKEKIKKYFFYNPTIKLRLRQIERDVKVPFPSVQRYAKEFEKDGILKSLNVSGAVLYSADRGSQTFIIEKKLFNIKLLYSCGLVDYLRAELSNPSIVVFGSYSKGEDVENSDIDLYVETPSKKNINAGEFEKILKRKIQFFRYKNIREVKNIHLANNILNGINLNGFVEVFT